MPSVEQIPRYNELMLPVLQAVEALGGSASVREVSDQVVAMQRYSDDLIGVQYPNRPVSILLNRLDWARSYCKLCALLESPRRGLFLLTPAARDLLSLPSSEAAARVSALERDFRLSRANQKRPRTAGETTTPIRTSEPDLDEPPAEEDGAWREQLLRRLHRLTPTGFEEFCMYLLREFGLHLTRVGGSGDEGVDGIGTAPLSEVLSATVAVQAKRLDPSSSISRDTVALFQRDASAQGAERAVFVTLARFTAPAKKAATTVTPRVDLIDGERLCELALAKGIGITLQPVVNEDWFERFDK